MEHLLDWKKIACIADDILVYGCGNNVEEAAVDHDKKLAALLNRCRMAGIRLNQGKLALRRKSIEFMGHRLSGKGLEVDSDKVEAIERMPPPQDVKSVQRLLGMAAYLAKFFPNFSEVTAPIRSLLDKQVEFYWDDDIQGIAFEKLKSLLRSAPVLQYFDLKLPTTVQCDSSQSGLGAVLTSKREASGLCIKSPYEHGTALHLDRERELGNSIRTGKISYFRVWSSRYSSDRSQTAHIDFQKSTD